MNRALYSGVAGLKAHQTRMDVIGNNISNVNTYGYKSQRAIFSDVFYQTIASATAGTSSSGGTNPSSVGYGSRLASVQANMSQSSMQSTSYGLDVAITGEGFFQVMDADGNIFYTKAGILSYDANGYLTDVNGNFVLGSSKADGAAATEKIKIDNLGSVPAAAAKSTVTINGIEYTLSASNSNDSGNVSIAIGSSDSLPAGQKATATISTTGAITVKLSSTEKFADIAELNTAINAAITEANGGKPHAAGNFTIAAPNAASKFPTGGLTGAEICGTDYSVQDGSISGADMFGGFMTIVGTSSDFEAVGTVSPTDFTASYTAAAGTDDAYWTISMTIGTETYSGVLKDGELAKSLLLKNTDSAKSDYIEVSNPGFDQLVSQAGDADTNGIPDVTTINALSNDYLTVTAAAGAGVPGTVAVTGNIFGGLLTIVGTNNGFPSSGTVNPDDFTASYTAGTPNVWTISMDVGCTVYSADVSEGAVAATVQLTSGAGDYIELSSTEYDKIFALAGDTDGDGTPDVTTLNALSSDTLTVSPATPSNDLGLSSVTFSLTGGTGGGSVTLDQLTSIAIGSDGVISVTHPDLGTVAAGKISLANFANPAGLQLMGSNYYSKTSNSGDPILCNPGSDGTGELQSNTLELSNVDLSSEFAEMITTQRGFQANSRIITVSDTMLEELINLKR